MHRRVFSEFAQRCLVLRVHRHRAEQGDEEDVTAPIHFE